jgi:hypothetical protein
MGLLKQNSIITKKINLGKEQTQTLAQIKKVSVRSRPLNLVFNKN